jgi:hypothetical protein
MKDRTAFGYVVSVEGPIVTLNLNDDHRGQVAAHRGGVSSVTDIAAVFGVNAGDRLMVMRTRSVAFNEPREAHRAGVGPGQTLTEPLRNVKATVIGIIQRFGGQTTFIPDCLSSPPLGAEAFPLNEHELSTLLRRESDDTSGVTLGVTVRGGGELCVGVQQLLSRHVAVLGSTGQGKSCLTAAVLQQLLELPRPRLVVFDVNGEYADALAPHAPGSDFKHTILGESLKIPYYALGRHGLSRLLLPSEKTQRPALNFALENLDRVRTFGVAAGAALKNGTSPVFFDDCRPSGADLAYAAVGKLRDGSAPAVTEWPHMKALSCLIAESQSLRIGTKGVERNAFEYGNVAPLITRVNRCIEDAQFCKIVAVDGGPPCEGVTLDWRQEARDLIAKVFGGSDDPWKIHVMDLRHVAHDLMPLVLGSLLELFSFELFERGPGATYPTALVLEEAHHYLRRTGDEDSARTGLAYERLAKEGRKFGVSIWISTQRPSEVSPTVLAQCGTWVVFRLAGEPDLNAVQNAAEWVDRHEVAQIPGLPRRQALVFGTAVVVPTRIIAVEASPVPRSSDPQFDRWLRAPPPIPSELAKDAEPIAPDTDVGF